MIDSIPVTYPVQSWDETFTPYTLAVKDSIELNQQKIPNHYVSYMEGVGTLQVGQVMKLGIGGMTGNKLFINYTLILDAMANKFGLIVDGLHFKF